MDLLTRDEVKRGLEGEWVFNADDASPKARLDSFTSFGTMTFVVDADFRRWDCYKKYKQELGVLYALGKPQPEETTSVANS
ncbi:hypothetical protein BDM02DRAFT_3189153 [Thelephora ganbajun]|uniref:Uncharacterized protein n=1 Tax=Thelephora ganbajun TaxID=370292 RepID=A0ACB6Z8Y4_THEGA|nr:hypothetical protein BDM02DRAFT_3189153 [Thelephora ganbajun]